MRFRSRPLLDAAEGQACVCCGREDGTIVAAHLPGSFYGMPAGWGQKTHDWLTAHLCLRCHALVDGAPGRRDARLRLQLLCLTLERLFEDGVLRVEHRC